MCRWIGLALTILVLALSSAQAAEVWPPAKLTPANPTSAELIQAVFTVGAGCSFNSSTSVAGYIVRTDVAFFDCGGGPPPVEQSEILAFGPLPPGSYSYEIYYHDEGFPTELRSQQAFVVTAAAAPAVPALSGAAYALLTTVLAVAAMLVLGRASLGH